MTTIPERQELATAKYEDAASVVSAIANGDENTEVITESGPTPTVKKWLKDRDAQLGSIESNADRAESAAALSAAASHPFPNTTDGLANTSGTGATNRYFSVPTGPSSTLATLYRNDAGAAVVIGSAPSVAYVDGIIPKLGLAALEIYPWINTVLDVIADANGNLRVLMVQVPGNDPVSYAAVANVDAEAYPPIQTATLLEAGILSVTDFSSTLYPDYVEFMLDASGVPRVLLVVGAGKDVTNYALPSNPPPAFVTPTGYYIWLVVNQSNEDGRGDSSQAPSIPVGMGYMWKGGALLPLADPVNTTTNTGSAWPAFAQRFYELTGFGSIFVPAAMGGTPQTAAAALTTIGATNHWDVDGVLRTTALSRLNAAIAALDTAGIMWQMGGLVGGGGERDAQNIDNPAGSTGSITAADYKAAVKGMLAYFQSSLSKTKLPFIMRRLARDATGDTTGFQQIRAAQMDLCANEPNLFMSWVGGLAAINAGRVKADTFDLHFLQSDLNDMGKSMATVAASVCLGRA